MEDKLLKFGKIGKVKAETLKPAVLI